jgi:hypothetical protein
MAVLSQSGCYGIGEEYLNVSKRDGFREPASPVFERALSRARFLQLVGAGVGLSLVPASLSGLGGLRVASAQTSAPTLLGTDQFPIGLWWPPPPSKTTMTSYQQIAAAGFNFIIGGNGVTNDTYNPTALDLAGKNNLRFVLRDNKLTNNINNNDSSGMHSRIDQLLQRYGGYAALAGLLLYDEPSTDLFGIIGDARQYLQTKNGKQLPWANLYPYTENASTLASLGASSYDDYLQQYRSKVNPPFVSFDHYPLVGDTGITATYFKNWAAIRNSSLQSPSVPSWCFIQSMDFKWNDNSYLPRRRPNEAELFWQVNVSLAYGSKGIQYFTYWTPQSDSTITYGQALVTTSGKLTPLYDYATRVNAYLKVVGKVLLPLTSKSVVHYAGDMTLPPGAVAFSPDGYVASVSGSSVILGSFSDPAGGTGRYLLVVNSSFSNQASTKLTLETSVSKVSELSTGTSTDVPLAPDHSFQLTLEPGRARLYLLQ